MIRQWSDSHLRGRDFRPAAERGGSRVNLLIFLLVLAVVGYGAYQYVPVAYRAQLLKVYMQDTVNSAAAADRTSEWMRQQILRSREDYGIPPEATVNALKQGGHLELHVKFTRPVPLPGFVYDYKFDHTVKSRGFLTTGK
ncbi:MAG: hypothetical protein ACRD9R_04920 [Pyrinomonadaceae bacterium]